MSDTHDPIYVALVEGLDRCPDGLALGRLGKLVRAHSGPPQAVDLRPRVLQRLREGAGAAEHLIDDLYDANDPSAAVADPGLVRLGTLLREGARPPRPVDLAPRVLERARRSDSRRRSAVLAQIDPSTRWRIWTAVIGVHVAALLAVLVLLDHWRADLADETAASMPGYVRHYRTNLARLGIPTPSRPERWQDLAQAPRLLMALRCEPDLRAEAERRFQLGGARASTQAALRWLIDQQGADGSWMATDSLHGIATQAAAVLALCADGLRAEPQRHAARQGLASLQTIDAGLVLVHRRGAQAPAAGLVALAFLEGTILLDDPALAQQARIYLDELQARPRDGFRVLALLTAELLGLSDVSWRSAVPDEPDLQALLAIATGQDPSPWATRLIERLPVVDDHRRVDALHWFLPGLALRDCGGTAWATWADGLAHSLLLHMRYEADGTAWLPATRLAHVADDNDILATALCLLNLQIGHRYPPMLRDEPRSTGSRSADHSL